MKHFTLLAFLVLSMTASKAQIEAVNYRGAFAPAPTPMWTGAWVDWNPKARRFRDFADADSITVTGNISTNTTWTANKTYTLSGVVSIDTLVTLTIEPGTIIRGNAFVPNSCLIVKRGAKLIAEGTPTSPIVFSSSRGPNNRAPGDWGGIILLGRARTNHAGSTAFIEGLAQGPGTQYGGGANPDDNDNSGVLKYVRIEFAGYVFQPNIEINGLTLGAVGNGTKIEYVQVSFTNDDSFEWFGGTVSCKYLIAYRGVDDDFDTDNGYSGQVQFCLGVRDPDNYDATFDVSGGSTSEGFESDNDATSTLNQPFTSATFSNVTSIGPFRGVSNPASDLDGFRRGARIRRNSRLSIINSVFMDWRTGFLLDNASPSTCDALAASGALRFRNNLISGARTNLNFVRNANPPAASYLGVVNLDSIAITVDPILDSNKILINPYNFNVPDYRPRANSPALTNFDFSTEVLPVTFTKFEGETVKNVHNLTWETSTEVDSRGFDLERSADGRNFSAIAFVATKAINGNSNSALSYSYQDSKPLAGISYYRLKQIDINGRSAYSKVLMLQTLVGNDLQFSLVYPNPVKSQLSMVVMAPNANRISVQIVDVAGRTISAQNFNVVRGSNQLQINVGTLSRGQYFIKATDANLKSANTQAFMKD